ncbi:GNAT family protein [Microbacterium luteolum]|uniref:GNAT family N-acetyltransferase n=1 Tax=Microbacterium luteolum TaxID=69367 RepID=A0ABY7XQS7_MICLT|nr:GNAT family protein [Microbacterium luteolum]WDM44454.1 GNAT family N-acetyltransferase [Microbacterium luteolum]
MLRAATPTHRRIPLSSERIELDLLTAVDVPAFVAYRRDPNVARYQSWDVDYDEQRAHRLVSAQESLSDGDGLPPAGEWVQLAVRDRQSRELLGDVAVHRLDEQPDTYEIGFTLAPAAQGQGFAPEAVRLVLDHLFTSAGAHRVTASCDARNEPSRRVLARVGFHQEARHVDADFFKGEWTTLDEFALLASEYETISAVNGSRISAGRR